MLPEETLTMPGRHDSSLFLSPAEATCLFLKIPLWPGSSSKHTAAN